MISRGTDFSSTHIGISNLAIRRAQTAQFDYPEFARLDKHRPDDEKQAALILPKQVDAAATHLGESLPIVAVKFDDSSSRALNVPHDWAIELPFDKKGDKDHGYKAHRARVELEHRMVSTLPGYPSERCGQIV